MNIDKGVIHSLDRDLQSMILSEKPLNFNTSKDVEPFIAKLAKAFQSSPTASKAKLNSRSPFLSLIGTPINFIEETQKLAKQWFDHHIATMTVESSNLLFAMVDMGDFVSLAMFEVLSKNGYIKITQNEHGLENALVHNQAILPETFASVKNAFMVNLTTGETLVKFQDIRYRELLETILDCEIIANSKTSFQVVDTLVGTISEVREDSHFENIVKAKQVITDNVDFFDEIEPKQILKEVFDTFSEEEERLIDATFEQEHVQDMINLKMVNRTQAAKKHRIVTELGIEIILPLDILDISDVVNISTDINGQVSIELKDIGKIL